MPYSRKLSCISSDTSAAAEELLEQLNILQEETERRLSALEKKMKEVQENGE